MDGRMDSVHRIAFVLTYGPVPPGMVVCHTCDNPSCCNPSHLVADTQRANVAHQTERGRRPLHERHPLGKLTLQQKRDIKAEYATGCVTLKQLGDKYGVTATTVHRITRSEHG
jgi:hypothetical protein